MIEPSKWRILKNQLTPEKEVKFNLELKSLKMNKEKLKIEKYYKNVTDSEEVIIIG